MALSVASAASLALGGVHRDEGMELAVQAINASQIVLQNIDRREAKCGDLRRQRVHGKQSGGSHRAVLGQTYGGVMRIIMMSARYSSRSCKRWYAPCLIPAASVADSDVI